MNTSFFRDGVCGTLPSFVRGAARSATLDEVMARLDKIREENAELRAKGFGTLSRQNRPAAAPVALAQRSLLTRANSRAIRFCTLPVATSPNSRPGPTIGGIPVKAGLWDR